MSNTPNSSPALPSMSPILIGLALLLGALYAFSRQHIEGSLGLFASALLMWTVHFLVARRAAQRLAILRSPMCDGESTRRACMGRAPGKSGASAPDAARILREENARLHAVGAGYSGSRELAARAHLLRLRAAVATLRLSGDVRALDAADAAAAEFLSSPLPLPVSPTPSRWEAGMGLRYGIAGDPFRCAVLHDSTLANDAQLLVSGNFADEAAQLAYAQTLAARLNVGDS